MNPKPAIGAGIIIYKRTKDGPRFLLLYRSGRYWNFPKGGLEQGERSFQTAVREVKEETGLGFHDLHFKSWFKVYDRYSFKVGNQEISRAIAFYLAETHKSEIKISVEHNGYGWFLYRDAQRVLIHQNLKRNLKQAYDFIIHRKSFSHRQKNPAR